MHQYSTRFSAIRIQRVKNGDSTEIIETLFQVLNEFKKEPELKNEYQNYELILQENSQLKNENFELKKQNQILKERIKYSNSTQEDEKTSPDNLKEDIHLLKQVLSHQQKFGKVIENTISKVESRINEFTESQSLTSKSEEHKTSSRNNHSPRSDKPSRDYLQFKQILDQICHNMKIDDYSLITPTFVRTISKLEDYKIFTNEMSKIVKSINSQNDSSFISLTRESSSKISNSIKNADLILSNLKKWKIELYHSQILKNFKFQIQNEIEKINILKDDPNIVNKTSLPIPIPVSIPKSIEISEIAFQKIILIIKNLIDFYISNITKQNPNQFNKISNQNQNQYENENEYEKLTQIIFHFEKKLGLKTNNNPLIAINTIYLELKRIQTQLQTFQKTLNVNESNSSFSECLTKIHNLIYFEKLYKNQIKI
ncbi:hypothetical protein M0811_05048 [Anaeramoeba ignava]|uniref:Uncharacterized protein n=1 Tax=Anaeramoeba ignava TaxID=1746090 RepID=A0A9Q0LVV1_ANAIG|nr:hypothetical protein M0811_05048 [Anaeramoeba ignava]